MDAKDFKVGIVGAGWIAAKAAETLNGLALYKSLLYSEKALRGRFRAHVFRENGLDGRLSGDLNRKSPIEMH